MSEETIPLTVTPVDDESVKGFEWGLRKSKNGALKVEIGDQFDIEGHSDVSLLRAVGLRACIAGMNLAGVSQDERRILLELIARTAGGLVVDEDEEETDAPLDADRD